MNERIEISGSDIFWQRLLESYRSHVDQELARHLGSKPDALERAAQAILARILKHSDKGMMLGYCDPELRLSDGEIIAFGQGLLLGNFLARHGITLQQKAAGDDLN